MLERRVKTCLMAMIVSVSAASFAQASSANFKITAEGQTLVAIDENVEIPQFKVKMEVGQSVTLVSQGIVLPRGGKPQASEADAAAWLFDDARFQLVPHDKKKFNGTQSPIMLKALEPGNHRVRFVGNILGYDRKFDVLIEVVEPKNN